MTDIKSQILSEVESELGSGAVMVVAEAMDKCPTLSKMIGSFVLAEAARAKHPSVYIDEFIMGEG